ncbi:ABC transporter ATP-binding protein [Tepidibacter hydrothermalis]|uniref:ABC transporter ATP-binding protein n=1 Tax=Tepidibacter hydrothermalis TaxID=3036126 RepID=A0ABY8E7K0_9FIRM|nr:ABC transporter ATP-binding protein [Tepidibacter hydrothermalis]WFD08867.1 ABC transporter ATP-binding protein [Tepidibacter hydrothermalis]
MSDKNTKSTSSGHRGNAMSIPVEKAKNFKVTLNRLLVYLKPSISKLILVVILAIFSTIFSILSPKIMGKATTKLFEGLMMKMKGIPGASIDFGYISNIIVILSCLYVVSAAFSYIMQYIMASVAQNTVFEMRKDVSDKLGKLPLGYYDSRSNGEILSRVTNDIDNVSNTLQQSITQLITSIITILGVIVMMFTISWVLTLITLITLPLSIIITKTVASKSQKFFKEQQFYLGQLNGHVEETYTGHKVVKAFSQEKESIKKFSDINNKLYNVAWRAQFISGVIMPLMSFVNNLGYVLVSVVGGVLVTRGSIQIGDVQAFIQYTRQFSQPIVQTANVANIIQSTIASAERVFEILDEDEEIADIDNSVIVDNPKGDVVFENVEFSYKKDQSLIKNMNINVKKGQMVAIVGPTGAGKTTLVNLLMRFYEIDGGRITVDGVDIRDFKRSDLRKMFGMVLQDTWLFKGSIRDNVAYSKLNATEKEIIDATYAAHADRFVRTLPSGYETILNEEADNISQGQKQLLTIARAILLDPPIMILDEATSSVDTRTESYIQKAMETLMKGRTSFVIAHRLSTIKDADIILVMNRGKIIEQGNHNDLMKKNGFYADLYNSQFVGNI